MEKTNALIVIEWTDSYKRSDAHLLQYKNNVNTLDSSGKHRR